MTRSVQAVNKNNGSKFDQGYCYENCQNIFMKQIHLKDKEVLKQNNKFSTRLP